MSTFGSNLYDANTVSLASPTSNELLSSARRKIEIFSTTRSVTLCVLPPKAAVTVTSPSDTAVTTPSASTVATSSFEDDHSASTVPVAPPVSAAYTALRSSGISPIPRVNESGSDSS